MATNTIRSAQNISQKCYSHCNKVHTDTLSRNTRKNRAPHHRSDRQNPPILNSLRCHCQTVNNAASTTSGPSNATEINTHLKPEKAPDTFHKQISHLTTHNTVSSMDTNLVTDTMIDGWTEFHTTLQVITSQGSKPLHVKVDPGAECSSIPLSHFCKTFPKHFTKSGALKKSALKPMWTTWSAHDGTCQNFLGYIVLDIQHKTLPQTLLCKFYAFEDSTSPHILLSYPASSWLSIVQFTVPNEAPVNFLSMISTFTNHKTVMFSQHPEDTPQKPHNNRNHTAKPLIKQPSQDHQSTNTHSQDYFLPFQDHKQPIAPIQDHKCPTNPISKDHLTTADVRDIIALKSIPQQFWHYRKHVRTVYNKSGLLSTPSTTCPH